TSRVRRAGGAPAGAAGDPPPFAAAGVAPGRSSRSARSRAKNSPAPAAARRSTRSARVTRRFAFTAPPHHEVGERPRPGPGPGARARATPPACDPDPPRTRRPLEAPMDGDPCRMCGGDGRIENALGGTTARCPSCHGTGRRAEATYGFHDVTKTKPSHHRPAAAAPAGPRVPVTPEGIQLAVE